MIPFIQKHLHKIYLKTSLEKSPKSHGHSLMKGKLLIQDCFHAKYWRDIYLSEIDDRYCHLRLPVMICELQDMAHGLCTLLAQKYQQKVIMILTL